MDVRYGMRVASQLARHPVESVTRVRQRRDLIRFSGDGQVDHGPSDGWEGMLDAELELPPNGSDDARFDEIYDDLERSLPDFPYANDADPALARALWLIARRGRIDRAVETGVARGVSSRFILEALEANRAGHLWSVDLPPLLEGFQSSVGAGVPGALRQRWTYVRGASARQLPRLFGAIAPIDLFVQDSVGTPPTVLVELEWAWRALRPRGWLVVNAVNRSDALARFVLGNRPAWHVVARAGQKAAFEDREKWISGQFAILRR